jgi:segregation and condensation protein A
MTGGTLLAGAELEVDLPLFSGPFRLLAQLILEQKLEVCDVPLGRITGRFLEHGSAELPRWSIEEATWFLATCAALLELKVGRLLPRAAAETEEDLVGGISPDLVYARSLELAAFGRAAEAVAARMAEAALMVARPTGVPAEYAALYPDPVEHVSIDLLQRAAGAALAPAQPLDLGHVTPIRITLSDALRDVQVVLEERSQARFRELVGDCRERIEVVVRFLAILELYREGKIELSQSGPLGDIEIRWHGEGAPLSER